MSEFSPTRLTNEEFRQIIHAALHDTQITVAGQVFDGRLNHDARELARLGDRVSEPDARTQALKGHLARPTLDHGALGRLSTPGGHLQVHDLPWNLNLEESLACILAPDAQAQLCLPGGLARSKQGSRSR